jgi:O-antigen/teichoic acid export membrane protein
MSIKRNTLYNVAAVVIPLAVTIVTFPVLLRNMGEARYGVLALLLAIWSYSQIFDFGLARATTNLIAQAAHDPGPARRNAILWTSLTVSGAIGGGVGLLVFVGGTFWLQSASGADKAFHEETIKALPFIAFAIPLIFIGAVFDGALAAREKFLTTAVIRIASTVVSLTSVVIATVAFNPELETVVLVSVTVSALTVAASGLVAARTIGAGGYCFDRAIMRSLVRYGGWVMLAGMIAPLLTTIDQFIIGAMLGPAAVTIYVIPNSLAGRMFGLTTSFNQAIFPRLSRASSEDAHHLSRRAARASCVVMTGLCGVAILLARDFLKLWLGQGIADKSGLIAEILFAGIWINSLAFVPYTTMLGRGRPSLVAKLFAVQALPYALGLWLLIAIFGVRGAALASLTRMAICSTIFCRAEPSGAVSSGILMVCGLLMGAAFGLAEILQPDLPLALALGAILGSAIFLWGAQIEPSLRMISSRRFGLSI